MLFGRQIRGTLFAVLCGAQQHEACTGSCVNRYIKLFGVKDTKYLFSSVEMSPPHPRISHVSCILLEYFEESNSALFFQLRVSFYAKVWNRESYVGLKRPKSLLGSICK